MAKTPERKLAIAKRLYDLAVNEYGLPAHDLLFDPLTFTIATGNEDDRKLAIWTLEGIEAISRELPGCCFPPQAERTYDRSFEAFARAWKL